MARTYDLRSIEERRSALVRFVTGAKGIVFSHALTADGAVVFAKACELGLDRHCVEASESLL